METADMIIPVSQYTSRILQEHYKIPVDKLFPVHNGIDPVKPLHAKKSFPEKIPMTSKGMPQQTQAPPGA